MNIMKQYMRSLSLLKQILLLSVLSLIPTGALGQESQSNVYINITRKSEILPPDVGTYKSDPGKYFDVSIINTEERELYVYFGMKLEYLLDGSGMAVQSLAVSTPADRPTNVPYLIPPGTSTLSQTDLRRLFNHIPTSALLFDEGLLSRVGASDFGLLPEGTYRVLLTAYLWDPTLVDQTGRISTPIPLSDPNNTGSCQFQVCYKAQAPQFTEPASMMGKVQTQGLEAIKLPVSNPILAWSEPIINCNTAVSWRYSVVIKEVLRTDKSEYLMTPDQALQQPSFITRMQGLAQPQYLLNPSQLAKLKDGHVYVAQVTAQQSGSYNQSDFGFALVDNGGKSEYILITPDRSSGLEPTTVTEEPADGGGTTVVDDEEDEDEDENADDEDEDEEEDDLDLELAGVDYEIGADDSTYVFRNPKFITPGYGADASHVVLGGNNLETEWERPSFVGGVGEQPDTLKFRYHVKIWTISGYATAEEALEQAPFYEAYVKGKMPDEPDAKALPKVGTLPESDQETAVDVTEDYIQWSDVEKFVSMNDVLLMRVIPECINEKSVRFFDDDVCSVVYSYSDKLSDAFGNACAEGVIMDNRKPIDISDADMKGKVVHVGEYDMEMGQDVKQASGKWSGSGWMLWTPFGQKVKVGVKFEGISINSDYIMYAGAVKSESKSNWQHLKDRAGQLKDDLTNTDNLEEWIPDDIFTEWGLDNLVSSATPEALSGYMESHKNDISGGVNSLASKVKASKYYDYVRKGFAVYDNFMNGDYGHMPDIEVFLPLQLPEKINPSPVDIQIVSMEWEPTRAWLNLLGMTTLPDNDITEENILIFGAPRTCMDPDRILPATGDIILFEDLTLNDPKSDFNIKFLAPQNKEKPEDGCMIHWEDDKLKMLSVKAEMEIPDLIKCDDNGKRLEGQQPKIFVEGMVEDWSDWYATVTMDPFEHEDLPGWTFKATDVTLDLSVKMNHPEMKFPAGYDKAHFPVTKFNPDDAWTGLFIKEVTVMMPEGFLKNGDKRFSISGTNMIFDKSGVTASIGLKEPVNTSIDDWALRVKDVAINIMQNDFNGCGMKGDIHVPLTEDDDYIAFSCDMIPVHHDRKKATVDNPTAGADKYTTFDFLLKIQPNKDGDNPLDGKLKFDFFLATLKLDNKQTYFILEAIDQGKDAAGADQGYETKVELCMAGDISIGGEKVGGWIQEQLDKLPLKVDMPGIHFTQMRLSNRKREDKWLYAENVREVAQKAYEEDSKSKALVVLGKNKTILLGTEDSPCYFDCGNWSVASASKKIGPFSFSIEDFDYGKIGDSDSVFVQVTGKIGFISNGSEPIVTAGTTLRLNAEANLKQKKLKYAGIKFMGCSLDIKTAGMRIFGELALGGYGAEGTEDHDDGYNGKLEFTMPGDLFSIKAAGGYYEHKAAEGSTDDSFSWGYFKAEMDSKAGIHADPLVINRIAGGFFFNCRPTKSKADPNDKFGGDPERVKGAIGIALGMGMSTTAGEETLKANVDLLVVYNKETKRLSTFMFNGNMEAVGGLIKADVSLIYEHTTMNETAVAEGPVDAKEAKVEKTKDRYLCLNVTVEFGLDSDKLKEKVLGANSKLLAVKKNMDEFQEHLDKIDLDNLGKEAPQQSLNQLSGDYEKNADGVASEGDEDSAGLDKESEDKLKDAGIESFSAGKAKITIEFMITWAKDGTEYDTPKWHLYVGEPEKDKRCTFTYLKFKSTVCSVDIGADGYLCLGNELPNNGALPEIPAKITEFLNGHQQEGTSMGADMQKVERSRAKAAKALLDPTSLNGGVMVGASCWGDISINLGLIYGSIESLAGFDASLINYGNNAVCANSRSSMGKNGWYALGQLYAYLAAELGIHIKIGYLIDEKVELINAGIGGVLEMGLPNPSWVEGQVRVKMSFLGGLFKLNKKFSFSAGDHCVPFLGNALDGFELFQNVSLGSDSLYEALYLPEFAISKEEAQRMIFTTNSSLGSHYRLVDPSYSKEIADETGADADKLTLHASRTYVFDMNQNTAMDGTKIGVRLIDMGEKPTELALGSKKLTPSQFKSELMKRPRAEGKDYDTYDGLITNLKKDDKTRMSQLNNVGNLYNSFASFAAAYFNTKEKSVAETSTVMKGKELSKGEDYVLHETNMTSYINYILDNNTFKNSEEVPVSFREEKGTTFHLTNMDLKKGHSYALVLSADAYEIDNGKRVWCDYYYDGDNKFHRIKWQQSKIWFFRVKTDAEDKVEGDSINDLTPYVALAYPSVDGTKVKSGSEGYTTAYYNDILKPTIALKRDLREELPEGDNLKWRLTTYRADEYSEERPEEFVSQQTIKAKYRINGSCYNLEPENVFNKITQFSTDASKAKSAGGKYDFNNELYHLQLLHTYYNQRAKKDSTAAIVDLWLTGAPHDVTIDGKGTFTDNWLTTTSSGLTGKLLPYVEPFVGARPWSNPTIDYVSKERLLTDKQIVFDNSQQYDDSPYRLIDPYLYLSYLSKWTFIGDRAISSYAWDDAEIPFGSESLIFEHNGTVINTEFLKDTPDKSLYDFRNDMYATWNDWHYNNSNLPEYPLPVTLGTVGGPTVVNQDNRASTITPLNLNHYDNQSYNITDLVEDFTAAYVVADRMCKALKRSAGELFDEFTWSLTDNGVDYKYLDKAILDWNRLHRGEYLEIDYRGVKVRVPYYQLPLIFGDCFYKGTYDNISLSGDNRAFGTTIGKSDITDDSRWPTDASNLLFFRLLGPEQFSNYIAQAFTRYKKGTNDNCYMYAAGTDKEKQVAWDQFDIHKALKAVSSFTARIYRVDAYDTNTSLYTVNGSHGAGPWTEDVSIGASSSFAKNMDETYNQTSEYRNHLNTHYDTPQPQALYSYEDKSLTFVYSDYKYLLADNFNGKRISQIWSGDDFTSVGWQNLSVSQYSAANYNENEYLPSRVETVTIDKSFADYELRSTAAWFKQFSGLKKVNGLSNLNTAQVTDMRALFLNCMQLESIDLSGLKTSNVITMRSMFAGCQKLSSINISNLSTSKLEDASYLFSDCEALKTITMTSFEALKATNTYGMFRNCKSLSKLNMEKFSPQDVQSCEQMFTEVPTSVSVYFVYDLDDRIKEQIPGKKYEQGNPVKAIYATDAQGQKVLLFINTLDTYKTGSTYNIKGKEKTYSSYKVSAVWTASTVLETTSSMPWNSYKSQIAKVIIDPSFKDSPKSLKYWFDGFTALTTIEGLENLNTKKTTDMSYMFSGCGKLNVIDLSKFNTENVTNMSNMFAGCANMSSLDVTSFNTKKVVNMANMFSSMSELTSLKLGWHFNTESATDMTGMFSKCRKLRKLESEWGWWEFSAKSATSLKQMFVLCEQLETLPNFKNMENVKDLSYMFAGCKKLNEQLSNIAKYILTVDVTNLTAMFKDCAAVEKLELVGLDTRNATNMSEMFSGCTSLKELNLSNLSTPKMTTCTDMFKSVPTNCTIFIRSDVSTLIHPNQVKKATHPNLVLIYPAQVLKVKNGSEENLVFLSSNNVYAEGGKWNGLTISEVWSGMDIIKSYREYKSMYGGGTERNYSPGWCSSWYNTTITKVIIDPSFSQVSPLSTARWFYQMQALTSIEGLEYLDMSHVESMEYMFAGCTSLKQIPQLSKLNTSNVKDMSGMFNGCSSLTNVDLKDLNTSNVESLSGLFYNCQSLTSVDLSSLDISRVSAVNSMFAHCTNLENVNMPKSEAAGIKDMAYMFIECPSLKEIDLSCIKLTNAESIQCDLFTGCSSLKKLTLGDTFNVKGARSSMDAFRDVHDLLVVSKAENLQLQRNDFVAYLGFIEGETGWFEGLVPETEQTKVAQAIWTEDNKTLTFYYGPLRKEGGSYGGRAVTMVWSGSYVDNCGTEGNYSAWGEKIREKVTRVVFDASFANVKPKSNWMWFNEFRALESIEGIKYLDTSESTSMFSMFNNCPKLETIDVSGFKTGNVKSMGNMFALCTSLTSLDLSGFDTRQVGDATYMFSSDKNLKNLKVGSNFSFDKMTNKAVGVFDGIKGLAIAVVPKSSTAAIKNVFVNKLGFVEGTNGDFTEIQAVWTAGNSTLTFLKGRWLNPGDTYNGQKVTNVWYEEDVLSTSGAANVLWRASGIREKVTTVVFDKSFAEVRPTSTQRWFHTFTNLTTIKNLSYLNTSEVTTMYSMFYDCSKLSSLYLKGFNTRKVTTMAFMFRGCSSLTSLDLSSFDTSSLTSTQTMFSGCSKLSALDLSKFNTSGITSANNMFYGCKALKKLTLGTGCAFDKLSSASSVFTDVSGLNVLLAQPSAMSKVKTAFTSKLGFTVGTHGRFVEPGTEAVQAIWSEGNTTLTFLLDYPYKAGDTYNGQKVTKAWSGNDVVKSPVNDMPKWIKLDANVRDRVTKVVFDKSFSSVVPSSMSYWFYSCKKLTTLTGMSYLNTSKVKDMSRLFSDCASLTSVPLTYFNTSNVEDMRFMFSNCEKLTSLNISSFNTKNVTNMAGMFYNCPVLTSLTFNSTTFNTAKVTNMYGMFYHCKGLKSLNLSKFDTYQVTSMKEMFAGCTGLTTLDLSNFSPKRVENMSSMFSYCTNLTSVTINSSGGSYADALTTTESMFEGCSKLKTVNFYCAGSVKTTSRMFKDCSELTTANLAIDATGDASYTFHNCAKLNSEYSPVTFLHATSIRHMFDGCTGWKTLRLGTSGYDDFKFLTDWAYAFQNCTSLTLLTVNYVFDTSKATSYTNVFKGIKNNQLKVRLYLTDTYEYRRETIKGYFRKIGFKEGTTGYFDK